MKKQTPIGYVINGVLDIIISVFALNYASSLKGEWEYYFDEDTQLFVNLLQIVGYICIISAIISFILAIVKASNNNEKTVLCPHCYNMISKHHMICPNCHNYIKNNSTPQSSDVNTPTNTPAQQNVPVTDSVPIKPTIECIFCGKQIDPDQVRCEHCGRRQD